jgi:hypothetical protein
MDSAGNVGSYSNTRSFTIDVTAPAAPTLNTPTNLAIINDNTPAFDWSDIVDPSTPVRYHLALDTESAFEYPSIISNLFSTSTATVTPLTALSDGVYFWKVAVLDAAGNLGADSSIYSFTIDTVSPDTTINSRIDGNNNPVINNGTTTSNSITFSFSGTPSSDINNLECSIDGSNFITCSSPTQFSNLTESVHTFRVRAVDALGNVDQTPAEHKWTVDHTGPTVTASPATGTFASNQSVALSSTATDLDAIYYTTDGSTPDNTDAEYAGPISISSTTTIKFIGYDTLGNAGPVGTETYTIDTQPPNTSLLSPNGAITNDQTPRFDWRDSIDTGGISRYTIQVSPSSSFSTTIIDVNIDGSPPESSFTPVTNLSLGTYFWRVQAVDGVGNVGPYSNTLSFTITNDFTGPTAPSLIAPANNGFTKTASLEFD